MKKRLLRFVGPVLGLMISTPAWAHPGHDSGTGFAAGFLHPLSGSDHLVAMLLVGLWAGVLVQRAVWLLPATFLGAMLAGFMAVPLLHGTSMAEPLILLSLLGLGGAAAMRWRAPVPLAVIAVALFGFAHGQAHGFETPHGALPVWFAAGFLLATGGLHALGLWFARNLPMPALRILGVAGMGLGLALAGTA